MRFISTSGASVSTLLYLVVVAVAVEGLSLIAMPNEMKAEAHLFDTDKGLKMCVSFFIDLT